VATAVTLSRPTTPQASPSSTTPADRFTPEVAVAAKVATAVLVEPEARAVLAAKAVPAAVVNTAQFNGKLAEATSAAVVAFHTARLLVALVDGVVAGTATITPPTPVVDWLAVTPKVQATIRLVALTATSTVAIATTAEKTSKQTPTVDLVDPAELVVLAAAVVAVEQAVTVAVDAATTNHATTVPVDLAAAVATVGLAVLTAPAAPTVVLTLVLVVLVVAVVLEALEAMVALVEPVATAATGVKTEAMELMATAAAVVTPAPKETQAALALMATALMEAVAQAVQTAIAEAAEAAAHLDPVVDHEAHISLTEVHFLSLTTAQWPVHNYEIYCSRNIRYGYYC
tara:strand:+ start:2824 stop:3852 length:1029 start_codon:yes stop_codon:yes gene_type:complete